MNRPRFTKPDENHPEIRDNCRLLGLRVIDTFHLPGNELENPCDMFVLNPRCDVIPVIVAYSVDDILDFFQQHPGIGLVQVEIKISPNAPFTPNEAAYLDNLGLWPVGPERSESEE